MQTLLVPVGKPWLQSLELAFQFVITSDGLVGPCQLSVVAPQVGGCAPAGPAERPTVMPAVPNGANTIAAAAANLFHEIMAVTPLRLSEPTFAI